MTLGESYHNFRHEFPSDYRNAIEWWQYDPTKWSIWMWKQLGLASNRVQQLQKVVDQQRAKIDCGVPLEKLPVFSWDGFLQDARSGKALVAIAGMIHYVTDCVNEHPGSKAFISSGIGKDATALFNVGIYNHSNAAHNLLSNMRVGVICGGGEVEIWRQAHPEKLAPVGVA